ncbi:MAG TPA: hypothetical protein PLV83_03430 [Bacilli bacterium]|nr:hypothetical protein [Bacilli bacterium]
MDSAYGVIDAGELYYSVDLIKNADSAASRYDFEIKNKKFVLSSDNTKQLKIKGSLPSTGTLQIYSNGKSAIAL